MASRECARCHRLYEKIAFEEVCRICFPIEENEFRIIKEYLFLHPGASSSEVMKELNISLKSLKRYLKQDRLEIIGDNKGFIRCELCGKPLNSGRFCEICYRDRKDVVLKVEGLGLKSAYISSNQQKTTNTKEIRYKGSDKK